MPFAIPEGVSVTSRENGTKIFLFIQNFNEEPFSVSMQDTDWKLLMGSDAGIIGQYETAVYWMENC